MRPRASSKSLSVRHEALREAQDRSASDYNSHSHALEADVLASDVQSESQSRSTELDRLRPQDNQGLDIKEVDERIRELKNEIEAKTKNGQHVKPEELAVLNATQKVHELLKTNPKAYEGMRPHIKAAFNPGRAALGSATGVAIIVSAAIGFYIKSQQGGQRAPGLPALDLPGA